MLSVFLCIIWIEPRLPIRGGSAGRSCFAMGLSFVRHSKPTPRSSRRVVLVTGAGGRIGMRFAKSAAPRYDLHLMIRPADEKSADELSPLGRIVRSEVSDLEQLKSIFAGVDTIVHLAGEPDSHATWSDLWEPNIVGTYNVMVAAKAAGCRRLIYASSIHAVSGYPRDVQVRTSEPVNPGDLYGVTKCFGEALGRYFAEQEGLSVIALRIGAFQPIQTARDGSSVAMMDSFISYRDLIQLICRCIDDEDLQFAIFHGVSDNRFKRLDISDARELLGFAPEDDFTKENPNLESLDLWEKAQSGNANDPGR
jgi:dTDP-4-dehydrorhamnose reductase